MKRSEIRSGRFKLEKILKNREQIVEASMPCHYMVWLDVLHVAHRLKQEIECGIFYIHSFIHSLFLPFF